MDVPAPIDSRQSAPVARAHKLLRPSGRAEAGLFLVEGPQGVREAAKAGAVAQLFATANATRKHPEVVAAVLQSGAKIYEVTDQVANYLSDTVTPQGLIAVVPTFSASLPAVLGAKPKLLVVLDQVQDPGNAGTIIRIADAAGADALLTTTNSVDVFNPKCVRSSAGSLFHLPIVSDCVSENLLLDLRRAAMTSIASAPDAKSSIFGSDAAAILGTATAWFFGNEANGLPAATMSQCDEVIGIPIFGEAESLNLAAAAAICIYASAKAHREHA